MNEVIQVLNKEREERQILWDNLKATIQDELEANPFSHHEALHIMQAIVGSLIKHNQMEYRIELVLRFVDKMLDESANNQEPTP